MVHREQYRRLELLKSPDYKDYDALERTITYPMLYSRCTVTCVHITMYYRISAYKGTLVR
jgi:hypothetical protein